MKLILLFLLGAVAYAQTATAIRVDPTPVFTISSRVAGTNPPILGVSGASISVCAYPANAVPCTNLATTYTDMTMAVSCPTYSQLVLATTSICTPNTDVQGNFGFWIGAGTYSYTITVQGASYGPYYVTAGGSTAVQSYVAPFSGAITTTVPAKIAQSNLSLADFCGTAGTTPLIASGCWGHAKSAAATNNQQLFVPAGKFSYDGPLTIDVPLQLTCATAAVFTAAANVATFIPEANNISIDGCTIDGQFTPSGYTAAGIDSSVSAAGSYSNWNFTNLTIQNVGGKSIQMCGGSATVSGWHLGNFQITGTANDNGGGIISLGPGCSNVLMDGGWLITQTNTTTTNTDGIQLYANLNSGIHPFQNIVIKDGTIKYAGGKIPLEMGNYCANPCTFTGGPITVDNVHVITLANGNYGNGFSFGNGISNSIVENSVFDTNGFNAGVSQCAEVTQSFGNIVTHNRFIGNTGANCGGYVNGGNYNTFSYNLAIDSSINIGATNWPTNQNYNSIDHNVITWDGSAQFYGIYMQNNTQGVGSGQWHMDHNKIESNVITFTNAACSGGSVNCFGVFIENDGTTGGIAYTQLINNKIFGARYPLAFNTSTLNTHTIFQGNIYDSSNLFQAIGGVTAANTDVVADPGNGTNGWNLVNSPFNAVSVAGAHLGGSGTAPTIAPGGALGTGGAAVINTFYQSSDTSGSLVLTTGSTGFGAGTLFTLTFATTRAKIPVCFFQSQSTGLTIGVPTDNIATVALTGTPSAASTQYFVSYFCSGI